MNRHLRVVLLAVIPPVGALLGALALLDFTAYQRFLWARFGAAPFLWVRSLDASPVHLLWLSGAASFVLAACCFFISRVRPALRWSPVTGWLATFLGLAAQLVATGLARQTIVTAGVLGCECICNSGDLNSVELNSRLVVADSGLLFTGAALALCALLGARRRPAEWSLALLAGLSTTALIFVWHSGPAWTVDLVGDFDRVSLLADQLYDVARVALVLLTLGLIGLRLRKRWQVRTRGGLLVCLLGGLAFVTTRGFAHDAQNPLPVVVEAYYVPKDTPLPALSRCNSNDDWFHPVATVDATGFSISGTDIGAPGSTGVLTNALEKLTDMRQQHDDLHSYAPEGAAPLRDIDLAFDAHLRMVDVVPVLQAVRATGYDLPHLASRAQRVVESRTAGRLVRNERCVRAFTFDADGTHADAFQTWGDFAKALDEGVVRLALPELRTSPSAGK